MKKNLGITKPCYSEHNFAGPLAVRYIKVPLCYLLQKSQYLFITITFQTTWTLSQSF